MGHWSESLVDEAARQIGGDPDRDVLRDLAVQVGRELELLSGRSFHPLRRTTSTIESGGLPFVDVPDLRVGSMEPVVGVWEIPDPVNRQIATVLQVSSLDGPAPTPVRAAKALWTAGQLVAEASQTGRLSRDYVLQWLGTAMDHEQHMELMRRVMDPALRFNIPILAVPIGGWWFQITRRLIWITNKTEDEGRLIELLLDKTMTGGEALPLAAVEPVLIAAPMTRQPVDWAFTARVWTEGVRRPVDRPWSPIAKAIHGHGMPTITIDPRSTPFEIARRERPHPGAQLRLTDHDRWRITVFATNTVGGRIPELRQRQRARAEDRIRGLNDSGLRNLPLHQFATNVIWLELVASPPSCLPGPRPSRSPVAPHGAGNPNGSGCGCCTWPTGPSPPVDATGRDCPAAGHGRT